MASSWSPATSMVADFAIAVLSDHVLTAADFVL